MVFSSLFAALHAVAVFIIARPVANLVEHEAAAAAERSRAAPEILAWTLAAQSIRSSSRLCRFQARLSKGSALSDSDSGPELPALPTR
jgi:hypothetical protein